ncbi:hypothetical protein ACHAWO_008260 [Cyclotella atomus]|uniref:Bromo domain-containing protein n=1 Tax=Cyclotella atomus TaxID=382360 RepID=A0ABD3MUR3_9STRA
MTDSNPASQPAASLASSAISSDPAAEPRPITAHASAASEQHRQLQHQLESLLKELQKKEPLDPTYDALLPAPFRKSVKSSLNASKSQNKEGAPDAKKMTADVKLHRRLNANLRATVETYASTPAGWKRRPNIRRIDVDFGGKEKDSGNTVKNEEIETKLRAAFALRESKEHEQRDLVNATLKAENAKLRRGWGLSQVTSAGGGVGAAGGQMFMAGLPPLEDATARKKRLEIISKQLKDVEKGAAERMKMRKIAEKGREVIFNPKSVLKPTKSEKNVSTIKQENNETSEALKRKREDLEAEQKQQIEDARIRELKRREQLEQEDAENKRRIAKEREEQERRERAIETPKDALHRLYKPIFDSLWDMEFEILGGVNPFRTVIDANNCAAMGAPDYCTVIKKPMNLTFIQTKVNNKSYSTLQEFLEDVDLIVKNALLYNSHPENPYNIAAKAFRKQFKKLAKPLVQSLTKGIVKTN